MKIAYLSAAPLSRARANVIQVMQMCAAFAESGQDVTLIADTRGTDTCSLRDDFGVDIDFKLRHLPARRIRGYSLYLAPRAAQVAAATESDIVYTRNLRAGACAALMGQSIVYEAHAPPRGRIDRAALKIMEASGRLVGIVSISSALDQSLTVEAPRLVAHDGANASAAGRFAEVGPQSDTPIVGYAGSAYPGKGVDFVVRLSLQRPDLRFEIVGPTKDEVGFAGLDLPENLRVVGRLPAAQVAARLRTYDILLAPYARSVSSAGGQDITRWMSPLKVFEYMAAGRPVIASDLPVLREVLRDGENAILCRPESLEDWSDALDRLTAAPDRAMALARTAQRELMEHYTWTARAEKIMKFIEGVSDGRS